MKKYLAYKDDTTYKLWEIIVKGVSYTIRWCQHGIDWQQKVRFFNNDQDALNSAKQLIAEKLHKGYVEVSSFHSSCKKEPVTDVTNQLQSCQNFTDYQALVLDYCAKGEIATVRKIIDAIGDQTTREYVTGLTLQYITQDENPSREAIRLLLQYQTDEIHLQLGLLYALRNQATYDIVKIILDARGELGQNIQLFLLSIVLGDLQVIHWFLDSGARYIINNTCEHASFELAHLVDDADLFQDVAIISPLLAAIRSHCVEKVKLLAGAGAKCCSGEKTIKPLLYAREWVNKDIIDFLKTKCATELNDRGVSLSK